MDEATYDDAVIAHVMDHFAISDEMMGVLHQLDAPTLGCLRDVFLTLGEVDGRPGVEMTNTAAMMVGGLVAAIEDGGAAITLDDMRRFMQIGYDDYFAKKREGKLPDGQ